jgi:hypothetical protein
MEEDGGDRRFTSTANGGDRRFTSTAKLIVYSFITFIPMIT